MAKASAIKAGEVYRPRRILHVLTEVVLLAAFFLGGWIVHSTTTQSANGLLDAGFTIVDPEGFEVGRFE